LQGESVLKRRTANDSRVIDRPRSGPVHPLIRDPSSLAALRHEMVEARARRDPWDQDGSFEVGTTPVVGFNPGPWGGIR
jgi:hypothetical protein